MDVHDNPAGEAPVSLPESDGTRYEAIPFSDSMFPIRVNRDSRLTARSAYAPITWHEQLEILVFLDGCADVTCDCRRILCRAGDIVIINPCETHTVEYRSGDVRYHCLMIDPSLYDRRDEICSIRYISGVTERRVRFRNNVSGNARVRALLTDIVEEQSRCEYGYEMAVKGDIFKLFAELFRREVDEMGQTQRNPFEMEQLSPALRYIAEHYRSDITLSDLAGACCMNRSYFCRRFHALVGRTAVTYINEYRLAKAQALLLTTSMSVSDVALATGFSDSSYFTRCYRALYGTSPSAARRHVAEKLGSS